MKLVKSIKYLDKILNRYRSDGFKIHLTPTMGALHAGHLKLVKESKKLKSIVVVSIFVNPTQFGPKEDYKDYPRTLKNDLKVLKKYGADIVFTPIQNKFSPIKQNIIVHSLQLKNDSVVNQDQNIFQVLKILYLNFLI